MATELRKAMSTLATAATSCRWSKGPRTIEVLRNKLAEAEEAAAAAAVDGEIPPPLRLQAMARSRLDAQTLTTCVQVLLERGLDEEARRLTKLCERLEPEESALATVLVEALPLRSPASVSRVLAIAQDSARPARIRLLALAWLIAADAARSAHAPILDIIGTAIDRRDWSAAQMGMSALKYLLWKAAPNGHVGSDWGKFALVNVLEWPVANTDEDDPNFGEPRWPDEARL